MAGTPISEFECILKGSEESRKFVDILYTLISSIETDTVTLTFDGIGLRLSEVEKSKTAMYNAHFFSPVFSRYPKGIPSIRAPHTAIRLAVSVLKEIQSREPDQPVKISYNDPFLSLGTDLNEHSFRVRTEGLVKPKKNPALSVPILVRNVMIPSFRFFLLKSRKISKDMNVGISLSESGLLLEAETEGQLFYTREPVPGEFRGKETVATTVSLLSLSHVDDLLKPEDCSLELGAVKGGAFYAKIDYFDIGLVEIWLAKRI